MPDGLEGNGELDREVAAIRAGQGHGYVELQHADLDRRVLLLERLAADRRARPHRRRRSHRRDRRPRLAAPCPPRSSAPGPTRPTSSTASSPTMASPRRAVLRARVRAARAAPSLARVRAGRAVLVHGDAHDHVLEDPSAPGRCKLIDPDAMRSEPAHDLGIVIRDEHARSAAGDARGHLGPGAAAGPARDDIDPSAIWDWAFAERVSTGLFLVELGDDAATTSSAWPPRSSTAEPAMPSGLDGNPNPIRSSARDAVLETVAGRRPLRSTIRRLRTGGDRRHRRRRQEHVRRRAGQGPPCGRRQGDPVDHRLVPQPALGALDPWTGLARRLLPRLARPHDAPPLPARAALGDTSAAVPRRGVRRAERLARRGHH